MVYDNDGWNVFIDEGVANTKTETILTVGTSVDYSLNIHLCKNFLPVYWACNTLFVTPAES